MFITTLQATSFDVIFNTLLKVSSHFVQYLIYNKPIKEYINWPGTILGPVLRFAIFFMILIHQDLHLT